MSNAAKIVAAAGLIVVLAALADLNVTVTEWVQVLAVFLAAAGVWVLSNRPPV